MTRLGSRVPSTEPAMHLAGYHRPQAFNSSIVNRHSTIPFVAFVIPTPRWQSAPRDRRIAPWGRCSLGNDK